MPVNLQSPINCTSLKTKRLARTLGRVYDANMATTGLKTAQYSMLTAIANRGPITPGALAERLGVEASTLTRNLQPLLKSGWVSQSTGADARSRNIEITEAKRAKQAQAQAHWLAAQRKVNALLGKDRVQALQTLIDECLEIVQSLPDGQQAQA